MRRSLTAIFIAVLLAVSAVAAFDVLSGIVFAKVLALVLALAVTMGLGVALRPERQLPLIADPFLMYCLFLGQFYLIGPIVMGIWGLSPIMFFRAPGMEAAVWPLLGGLIMVACSILGYRWDFGRLIADHLPDFAGTPRKLPRGWIIAAIVLAGVLGSIGWIQYQGGIMAKLGMGYGEGRSGAAFTLAFHTFVLGTLLWAWQLMDSPSPSRRAIWAFWGLIALEAMFFGVIYGVRKYLFFLFFGLVVCWSLRRGVRTLPKVATALAVAALLVFFAVWGSVRARSVASLLGFGASESHVQTGTAGEGFASGVADPFGSAALIFHVFPEDEPFRHGGTLLVTLLGFIPRAVWPDKPVGIGKDITRYYVGPFYEPTQGYSVTVTLPADLYANFGWPGVAFGGLLLGIACRVMAAYAVRGMKDNLQFRAARVILPAVFIVGLGEVRADMSQILALYIMAGIPACFALAAFHMDGRHREAAA